MKEQKEKKQSFIAGAAVLAISVIIVKIIGMVYKVVLANFLGGVGNGIFTAAYELYIPLYTLATAGFPIAVSRMTSESIALKRYKDVRQIYKVAVPFFLIAGLVSFLLMVAASKFYVQWVEAEDAIFAINCLAPTILFGCMVSVYRGYFEGHNNMVPTAVSEIIEALSKLVIGLSLAYYVQIRFNNEYSLHGTVFGKIMDSADHAQEVIVAYTVAAAILGITIGSLFSFIYIYIRYKFKGQTSQELIDASPESKSKREILSVLIKTALPIGLGAIVMSIAGTIDSSLILIRINDIAGDPDKFEILKKCYDGLIYDNVIQNGNVHKYLSGCYSYSLTIIMLVTSLTQVFGTSALPNVTRAHAIGNKDRLKKEIETVLRLTTFVTLPCGLGLAVLSKPVLSLLYSSPNVSCEVEIAARVLQVMGFAVIFSATSTPICSMLQAVKRMDVPLKLFLVSTAINMTLNFTLIIIPQLNIIGAAIGTLVAYMFVCFASLYILCKETKIMPDFVSVLLKPLIAAIICAASAYSFHKLLCYFLPGNLSTVISIVISAIIYFTVLLIIRGITKNDVLMLPSGNKILKTLEKLRIMG